MKLETRYIVLKHSDVNSANLTYQEIKLLGGILSKIYAARIARNKGELKCLIIEKDWPEYEPTLELLAKRVDNAN